MILLEQLSPGMQVRGLDGARTAEVIAVERFGSQAANVRIAQVRQLRREFCTSMIRFFSSR